MLEDFLCLTETRSFSRAAADRHITQSAFSRRIMALEEWLGVSLVDRSVHPVTLTSAGWLFRRLAADLVRDAYAARILLSGHQPLIDAAKVVQFAVAHTLLFFNEIKRCLGGIIQKALTQSLRRLEPSDVLIRGVIPSSQIAVEYSVSPLAGLWMSRFGPYLNGRSISRSKSCKRNRRLIGEQSRRFNKNAGELPESFLGSHSCFDERLFLTY